MFCVKFHWNLIGLTNCKFELSQQLYQSSKYLYFSESIADAISEIEDQRLSWLVLHKIIYFNYLGPSPKGNQAFDGRLAIA